MRHQDILFYIAVQLSLILLGLYGFYLTWLVGVEELFTEVESLQPVYFLARLGFAFSWFILLDSVLNLINLREKL